MCIAVYFPEYVNTDKIEEKLLLCASFTDSVAMHYSNCIDANFIIFGDLTLMHTSLLPTEGY